MLVGGRLANRTSPAPLTITPTTTAEQTCDGLGAVFGVDGDVLVGERSQVHTCSVASLAQGHTNSEFCLADNGSTGFLGITGRDHRWRRSHHPTKH